MDISIIISGNLTGFSRFYASANANDIYNEAKFDFDYRNFLTFINAGEKAYAISFSPKVIAVSLITRILDSFRRPGILVVTALVPRYQLVSGTLNAQDKSAIYRLLNEINDKFYEKNFLNGMVNQNPAVLMQDYYSDILRNYALVSDRMQKAINTTIEVNAPNKRIGYVSTSEKDMPKYLSSLMRKSYNGYHHVFFADKAPTNIDEPAEEIVTYRARVENGNRNVPGEVRLTDKIPTVVPEQGEKPLSNTNFTYGQVLNGEAGSDIIATIENDTIVLSFRFPKEEKTIYFKFFDGANELPIPLIRPILVESNGTLMPISTDSFTFYGKEIYGRKTIKSGNPEYTVDSSTSVIDLQRYNNGATINVYVSKGWTWTFDPKINNRPTSIKPISITLVNKYTGEKKYIARVTGYASERLSGTPQEWEMQVESDYYKSATFPAIGPYRLEPKPQPTPASHGGSHGGNGTNVQRGGTSTRTAGNSGQQFKLSGGQNDTAKEQARIEAEKKKRYIQIGIYAVVAIICCIGGWWAYTKINPTKPDDPTPDNNPIIAKETSATKNVEFRFIDCNGKEVTESTLEQLSISLEPMSIVEETSGVKSYNLTYDTEADPAHTITIHVSYKDVNMLRDRFENSMIIHSLSDVVDIPLSVSISDINLYNQIIKGVNPTDYPKYHKQIEDIIKNRNENYGFLLAKAIKPYEPKESDNNNPKVDNNPKTDNTKTDPSTSTSDIPTELDAVWLAMQDLNRMKGEKYSSNAAKKRIASLKSVLYKIGKGQRPNSSEGLGSEQKKIVDDLMQLKDDIDGLPETTEPQQNRKLELQIKYKEFLQKGDSNGKISLSTANAALSLRGKVTSAQKAKN